MEPLSAFYATRFENIAAATLCPFYRGTLSFESDGVSVAEWHFRHSNPPQLDGGCLSTTPIHFRCRYGSHTLAKDSRHRG
ncbi:protein of unknown function (plasmid) [Cupriavidus taiwanensis]|uniref:Uncharacterized protein n=1 Tax=Cupriavidus taiwanensis TaxID=164546 RepID=A0A9Q7V100_9BURK|nr:protein of unknown function [Cupriavidus taiwanensis]